MTRRALLGAVLLVGCIAPVAVEPPIPPRVAERQAPTSLPKDRAGAAVAIARADALERQNDISGSIAALEEAASLHQPSGTILLRAANLARRSEDKARANSLAARALAAFHVETGAKPIASAPSAGRSAARIAWLDGRYVAVTRGPSVTVLDVRTGRPAVGLSVSETDVAGLVAYREKSFQPNEVGLLIAGRDQRYRLLTSPWFDERKVAVQHIEISGSLEALFGRTGSSAFLTLSDGGARMVHQVSERGYGVVHPFGFDMSIRWKDVWAVSADARWVAWYDGSTVELAHGKDPALSEVEPEPEPSPEVSTGPSVPIGSDATAIDLASAGQLLVAGFKGGSVRLVEPTTGSTKWATTDDFKKVTRTLFSGGDDRIAILKEGINAVTTLAVSDGTPTVLPITDPGDMAFSPDGARLAVVSASTGEGSVFDASGTGRELRLGAPARVDSLVVTGGTVLAQSRYRATRFDLATGKTVSSNKQLIMTDPSLVSADGRRIRHDMRSLTSTISTSEGLEVSLGETGYYPKFAWSPDGTRVAIVSDLHGGLLRVADASTGTTLTERPMKFASKVYRLRFAGERRVLATADFFDYRAFANASSRLIAFDADTTNEGTTLLDTGRIIAVATSADGNTVAVAHRAQQGGVTSVDLLRATTAQVLHSTTDGREASTIDEFGVELTPGDELSALQVADGGRYAVWANGPRATLWWPGRSKAELMTITRAEVGGIALAKNDRIIAVAADSGSIRFFDARDGRLLIERVMLDGTDAQVAIDPWTGALEVLGGDDDWVLEPHPSPRTVSLCSLRADLSL